MLISIALLFLLSPLSSLQTPTSLKRNTTGTSLPNSAATTGVTLSLPKPLIVAASTTTTGNAKQKSQSAPSSVPKSGPAANNNNAPSSLPKTSSGAAVIKLNQTTSSSSSSSSSSPLPSKPNAAPVAAKAVKDNKAGAAAAPSSPHPIKVVITDGCLQKEQKTDANSSSGGVGGGVPVVGMAPNKELTLKPGSPLVMTHHISLVPSTCTGGCEAEMAALKGRVEYLEKEMAAMKKMCTSCSAASGTCPNGCSGQGRCEEGKCVCNAGHSGADCSTQQACPANCNKRGKCVKGKCVCNAGFSGMDCGKGSEKKVKVTVETVTMKVTPEMNTIKETTMTTVQKTKVDKTIFVKTTDKDQKKVLMGKEADVQGQTKVKTAGKPGVSLKTDTLTKVTIKPAANATKTGGKVTKTVGQVFLKQSVRRPEQATKGKTEVKKIDTKAKESSVKKVQLKDQPLVNVTQTSVKKMNGTSSKVLTQLLKVSKPTVNVTASEKTTMRKSVKTTTGTQAATGSVKVIIKTGTVKQTVLTDITSTDKEKKPIQANATVVLKEGSTLKRTESQLNGTTVETKIHTKQTDKTSLKPANTAMTVSVQNITSSSFILSWETSQSVFRNFTLTRRELAAGADWEQEVVAEEEAEKAKLGEKQDVSITTATSSNMTEVVKHTSADTTTTVTKAHVASATKSEGKNVRKFTQVLPGTARSFQFRNLRPQTRYALTLFGTAPGFRSKIYRLTVTTGPEPPSEIVFTNVTESSVTVSWTKPKSTVTGFKVIYTNVGTGASGSLSMESQLSMVVISKLSAGTSYEISVTSVLEASESDALRATVVTAPDTPTVLQAVNVTDTKALLVWKPTQAKVDRYILSYGSSKSPNVTVTVMLSGSTVEHHLRGLHRSTLYTVTLVSQLNSLQSAPVTTTFTTATGVKVQAGAPNTVTSHSAVIAWKAPHVAFKTYRLTYQVLGQETKEVLLSPTVIQYELTGLKPGSNYTVKVEGEKEGSYITVVSTEFLTGGIPFHYPKDCSEVQRNGMVESGEAEIFPEGPEGEPVLAYCDMETDGGGWTVFQRRAHGKTDFFRGWKDYSKGFGFLSDEFWLGNDHIHTLTSRSPMTLRVDLRSGNDTAYAHYANFSIGSEESNYTIHVSGYSGNSGDSMRYHSGRPFSTKDRDPHPLSIHCAKAYMGGWWYKNCYKANLNGLYATFSDNQGVVWIDWKGKDVSIPFTEMKLRPASFLAVAQG